ncbi:MAG: anti-sigma factor [Candidatus Koribacter versatilis]|uniref:Anti-sigma factor n=1 Tax=Candidatus Korobacter versatilis TaxID=658062 RepID=A0A932EPM5_9BACT|nr:anti-sigma factor [Candidatus Koribacter versatilis]
MNCAEFQKSLPEIIDGAGTAEQDAHGQTCPVCSDLVRDLRYIAEQAKLLMPMHDPSPRVWAGIQTSLAQEGLVRPSVGRFQPTVIPGGNRFGTYARWGAVAALAIVAFWLIGTRTPGAGPEQPSTTASDTAGSGAGAMDANDQKLLAVVSQQAPERAEVYKRSMRDVNSYIADARKSLDQDPSDDEAREHLLQAYDQKAMLYDMATSGPRE